MNFQSYLNNRTEARELILSTYNTKNEEADSTTKNEKVTEEESWNGRFGRKKRDANEKL